MKTLEEFQKQVLAPLRKERDDKQDAARESRSNAAAEYMKAKKMIEEKNMPSKNYKSKFWKRSCASSSSTERHINSC